MARRKSGNDGSAAQAPAPQAAANPSPDTHYVPEMWEKVTALGAAVCVLALTCWLILRNQRFADPNLVVMLRIILSFASAGLGATIPGFLHVSLSWKGVWIRAGGALALFVLTFFFSPSVVKAELSEGQLPAGWAQDEVARARKQAEEQANQRERERIAAAALAAKQQRDTDIEKVIAEYLELLTDRVYQMKDLFLDHKRNIPHAIEKQFYVDFDLARQSIIARKYSVANQRLKRLKTSLSDGGVPMAECKRRFFAPISPTLGERIRDMVPELGFALELFEDNQK